MSQAPSEFGEQKGSYCPDYESEDESNGDGDGGPVYDEKDSGGDLVGDRLEIFIIRKSLLAPKSPNWWEWLRTNIFYATCTIIGKVCRSLLMEAAVRMWFHEKR